MEQLREQVELAVGKHLPGRTVQAIQDRGEWVRYIVKVEFLPTLIGGFDTPSLFDSPPLKPGEWPAWLKLISARVQAGGRVWPRYRVSPPSAPW